MFRDVQQYFPIALLNTQGSINSAIKSRQLSAVSTRISFMNILSKHN